jgi:hypothetical protein
MTAAWRVDEVRAMFLVYLVGIVGGLTYLLTIALLHR